MKNQSRVYYIPPGKQYFDLAKTIEDETPGGYETPTDGGMGGGGIILGGGGGSSAPADYGLPSTAQMDTWDCPTLQSNIQSWNNLLVSAHFADPGQRTAIENARDYAQGRYNSQCNVSLPPSYDPGGGGPILPPPMLPVEEPVLLPPHLGETPPDNKAPHAVPGNNVTIKLPSNAVELDGSQSFDPENGDLTYAWVQEAGPSTPQIQNANKAKATIAGLIEGFYTYRLTVTDGLGSADTAMVNITVQKADGSPVVNTTDTTINTTAPVIVQQPGPYFTSYGSNGGGGAATPAGAAKQVTKPFNWLIWAFVIASTTYIIFGKNDK